MVIDNLNLPHRPNFHHLLVELRHAEEVCPRLIGLLAWLPRYLGCYVGVGEFTRGVGGVEELPRPFIHIYGARNTQKGPSKCLPHLPDTLFGWIPVLYRITEHEVLTSSGLDAFVVCFESVETAKVDG